MATGPPTPVLPTSGSSIQSFHDRRVAVASVDLELELADGKHVTLCVCGEERRECVKLLTLDVDFDNVNERVPWIL